MKKPFPYMVMLLCVFILSSFDARTNLILPFSSFSEYQYSQSKIESFIREVFADQADQLVFNKKSRRLQLITDFFGRFTVNNKPEYHNKKIQLLSEIELTTGYNPGLKRDLTYNVETFNPLKYKFPMWSKTKLLYRIDNTDFIIAIAPVK